MINSSKHIINKVFLEINTNSKEKGYYLKDNIDSFLQKEIFSILETYFNELDSKNPLQSIQLEKLNIDIAINPDLDLEDFKNQILKEITKQVDEVFEKKDKNIEGYKVTNAQEKEIESFFYFLETGTSAWWTTFNHDFRIADDTIFEKVLNDETFAFKWSNSVQKPIARTRFIKQFSDDQIVTIIKKGILLKKNNADSSARIIRIEAIKKHLGTSTSKSQFIPNQRFLIWEIAVLSLAEINIEIVKQKLSRLIYNVFEFHKKSSVLEYRHLLVNEIKNQIENQDALELLANLEAVILVIEKKVDKSILKENEKRTETGTETITNTAIINTETATESIQENIEKTISDSDLILSKNKDEIVRSDEKNIESLSDNLKEKALNDSESSSGKKEFSVAKEQEEKEKEEETKDINVSDLYVDNAGLLLIHPFLKSLFENCKLLDKENTINNPETAAHLLHYIATGREQDYENTMAFEKFLCNIPIAKPIERNIVLSDEMKKEGAEMLQAVLNNWEIMKTSSAGLLQNEFLQRPGKLSTNADESSKIIIERKTQDILLDKLSWNLSIIKLAWKKRIIYVDW